MLILPPHTPYTGPQRKGLHLLFPNSPQKLGTLFPPPLLATLQPPLLTHLPRPHALGVIPRYEATTARAKAAGVLGLGLGSMHKNIPRESNEVRIEKIPLAVDQDKIKTFLPDSSTMDTMLRHALPLPLKRPHC